METGGNERAPASVGAQLRAARERQGLSLADLASRLRLTEDQIAALEEEDFGYLHGETFVRGYLRNYARSLDLDPEAVIQTYQQSPTGPGGSEDIPLAPPTERPILEHPWRVALISLVLVVLVAGGVLGLMAGGYVSLGGGSVPGATETPGEPPLAEAGDEAPGEASSPVGGAEDGQTVEPEGDAEAGGSDLQGRFTAEPPEPIEPSGRGNNGSPGLAPQREAAPDPDEMRVRTWEKSWLEVTDARGRVLIRRLVSKGKELHLYGQAPFGVKVGNAAGVQLYYEEDPLPPLGDIGQVVTRTVGPDSQTIPEEEVGPPEVLLEARRKGLPTTGDGPPQEEEEAATAGPDGEPASPREANGQGG